MPLKAKASLVKKASAAVGDTAAGPVIKRKGSAPPASTACVSMIVIPWLAPIYRMMHAASNTSHAVVSETALVAISISIVGCSMPAISSRLVALLVVSYAVGIQCPEPSVVCRRNVSTGTVLGTLVLPTLFAVQAASMDAISVAFRLTWWCGIAGMAMRMWQGCLCAQCHVSQSLAYGSAMLFVLVSAMFASGDVQLLPALMIFLACFATVQKAVPRSFTIGEAMIVSELCAVLCHVMLFSVILDIFPLAVLTSQLRLFIAIALVSAVGISAGNLVLAACLRRGYLTYLQPYKSIVHMGLSILGTVLMFEWMSYSIGENSLGWLWLYISSHTATPLKFLVYYVVVIVPALYFAPASNGKWRRVLVRKYFHVLALVMFVPTILVHIRFMALAFACAIALFMVVESLRISGVEPVVSVLNPYFEAYLDERDEGAATLTHIYLLLGCALPVFFTYFVLRGVYSANGLLIALSGVAVTGLGDAVASYCGVNFGRHRWHESKKTIEGTASMIVAVFIFQVICLIIVGFQDLSAASWARLLLADVLVSLLEAKTDQIDNLFLPLYHVALLQLV